MKKDDYLDDDVEIMEEEAYEFELTDEVSLIYNVNENNWYMASNDDVLEENIAVIDTFTDGSFEAFDYTLNQHTFEEFKEIVKENLED